jgi:1-deoxy-D-xylulose-5-phosphate synthase
VVELTIALHRVFDSPRDVILFDTGHQSYVHKLLTGRQGGFSRLRKENGLSGYPARAESPHDWVENSHASTAVSYADGLARALRLSGRHRDRRIVAVVGDGALTGGLAWEGLNNLGTDRELPVIVVLNDNGRSYAPTVGGLARHLTTLRDRPATNWFEQIGLAYLGPVDGHDTAATETVLRQAAALGRPVVVHVLTGKGRGYGPAEADEADHLHGIGVLDPATGLPVSEAQRSWTDEFGAALARLGEERDEVVCLTAAMLEPVGLGVFARRFPERVFDVGLGEQHAVCSAAGLAMGGLHPVVCLYATFLNRAFDQVLMDVALHDLPVTFVLDRAGITGPDGPSHHGVWDLAMLTSVPGIRIAAPRDTARLGELLHEAVATPGPTVLRFPKQPATPPIPAVATVDGLDILHRTPGSPLDVLLVGIGAMAAPCLDAVAELENHGIGVTIADPRWAYPISPALVRFAAWHALAVCVEDGVRAGGIGAALTQACADADLRTPVRTLGLPPTFIPAGDRAALLRRYGLTPHGIAAGVIRARPADSSPWVKETLGTA